MGISISGIASGMDTDSMVTELINIESMKVDNVRADKQLAQWKQTEYRSVISSLKDFQSSYLDIASSKNSMRSANTFNAYTGNVTVGGVSSSLVLVAPTAYAQSGSHSITNIRVAKTDNWEGSNIAEMEGTSANPSNISAGDMVDFEVDGVRKTMVLSGNYAHIGELASDLQQKFNTSFGTNKVTVSEQGGKLNISAQGHKVQIFDTNTDDLTASHLGFTSGDQNTLKTSVTLGETNLTNDIFAGGDTIEFKINDIDFNFTKDGHSMQDVFDEVNNSDAGVKMYYSELSNKIMIESKETGFNNKIAFEDTTGTFLSDGIGIDYALETGHSQTGTDATFELDGVTTSRSNNNFTIDGMKYTLTKDTDESIDIAINTNTDSVKDTIKGFVEAYNKLVDDLNSKVTEKRYTDFAPLSDAQKKDMSDDEVEKWEEKAKSGLLRSDNSVQQVLYDMRNTLYGEVEGAGVRLFDLGITTSPDYLDGGKLIINEKKLDDALSNQPEAIRDLFSSSEGGIGTKLNDVIEKNISITGDKGLLLHKAGLEGTTTESENALTREIKEYDKRIEKLLDDLKVKENYYFDMFAQMEKAMQQMNDQSEWLMGQLNSM